MIDVFVIVFGMTKKKPYQEPCQIPCTPLAWFLALVLLGRAKNREKKGFHLKFR